MSAKPPPTILGVQGIGSGICFGNDPGTPLGKGYGTPPFDLYLLSKLPAFQMYAAERAGAKFDFTDFRWVSGFIGEAMAGGGTSAVVADYRDWFERKGLWPNETPDGKLKD